MDLRTHICSTLLEFRLTKVLATHLLRCSTHTGHLLGCSSSMKNVAFLQPFASIQDLLLFFSSHSRKNSITYVKVIRTAGTHKWQPCANLIRSSTISLPLIRWYPGIQKIPNSPFLAGLFIVLRHSTISFDSVVLFCKAVRADMLSEHICTLLWHPSCIVSWFSHEI